MLCSYLIFKKYYICNIFTINYKWQCIRAIHGYNLFQQQKKKNFINGANYYPNYPTIDLFNKKSRMFLFRSQQENILGQERRQGGIQCKLSLTWTRQVEGKVGPKIIDGVPSSQVPQGPSSHINHTMTAHEWFSVHRRWLFRPTQQFPIHSAELAYLLGFC